MSIGLNELTIMNAIWEFTNCKSMDLEVFDPKHLNMGEEFRDMVIERLQNAGYVKGFGFYGQIDGMRYNKVCWGNSSPELTQLGKRCIGK